eukprot:7561907-Alexandrium_andersonii.AAC.1
MSFHRWSRQIIWPSKAGVETSEAQPDATRMLSILASGNHPCAVAYMHMPREQTASSTERLLSHNSSCIERW